MMRRRGVPFDIAAGGPVPAAATAVPREIVRQRRLALALLLLGVLIGAALALHWWLMRPEFAVKRLRIEGPIERVNPTVVRAYAVGRLHGGLFGVDLREAKRVFEQVPWVRRAVVRRLWPNALLVEIEEHRPVAFWGDEGDQTMLNQFGEVFVANTDEVSDSLPRLLGPNAEAGAMLVMLQRINRRLQASEWTVEQLSLDERREWEMDLNVGLQVMLGSEDAQFWRRLDRLLATQGQAERMLHQWAQGRLGKWVRVDLRHEQGYAVAAESSQVAAAGSHDPQAPPHTSPSTRAAIAGASDRAAANPAAAPGPATGQRRG